MKKSKGSVNTHPARVYGNWIYDIVKDYPQVEKLTAITPYRDAIVKIDNDIFYSDCVFSVDSSFFDIFDFKVLKGVGKESLKQPQKALITQSLAKKYFGTDDVVGKSISITHQLEKEASDYIVGGVIDDVPENSHFHIDILTSQKQINGYRNEWAYVYYLVKPNTDLQAIAKGVEQKFEENSKMKNVERTIHFQKLTDIHLHSNKSRELEQNGSSRSLFLLNSGVLIVLFIALINFFNLSRVQFISEIKTVKVKIINGATKRHIILDKLKETLPLLLLSIICGLFFTYVISEFMNTNLWANVKAEILSVVAILFVLGVLVLITAFLSMTLSEITAEKQMLTKHYGSYRIPLILQLVLSIVTIAGTMVLHRQMSFVNSLHPAANATNMLIIPEVPMEAAKKYDLFKQELLKNPQIASVTAAMEKPGGNIIDNFPFEMEGLDSEEKKAIKVLTVDANFFHVLKVKPIAGSVSLTKPTLPDWEQKALQVGLARMYEGKTDEELKKTVENYEDTYVINESAIKLLGFSNPEEAIGKRLKLTHGLSELFPEGRIIGVVPDFHYTNLFNKEEPMLILAKQMFSKWFIISLNTTKTNKVLTEINSAWETIYPDFPFRYEFMSDNYKMVYKGEYMQTKVLSFFALVSILLSAIGIFALTKFSIQRRTKEIGIRKINGATITEILTMLNKSFVKWIAIAFVIATPIAYYAMTKWLENFAYKTALSWWIFALAGLSALLIALLTVSWQSWRAASRNPVEALRYE